MMVASANIRWSVPVLLKNYASKLVKFLNTACVLQARDYKGFGRQEMNGVITCREIKKKKK